MNKGESLLGNPSSVSHPSPLLPLPLRFSLVSCAPTRGPLKARVGPTRTPQQQAWTPWRGRRTSRCWKRRGRQRARSSRSTSATLVRGGGGEIGCKRLLRFLFSKTGREEREREREGGREKGRVRERKQKKAPFLRVFLGVFLGVFISASAHAPPFRVVRQRRSRARARMRGRGRERARKKGEEGTVCKKASSQDECHSLLSLFSFLSLSLSLCGRWLASLEWHTGRAASDRETEGARAVFFHPVSPLIRLNPRSPASCAPHPQMSPTSGSASRSTLPTSWARDGYGGGCGRRARTHALTFTLKRTLSSTCTTAHTTTSHTHTSNAVSLSASRLPPPPGSDRAWPWLLRLSR